MCTFFPVKNKDRDRRDDPRDRINDIDQADIMIKMQHDGQPDQAEDADGQRRDPLIADPKISVGVNVQLNGARKCIISKAAAIVASSLVKIRSRYGQVIKITAPKNIAFAQAISKTERIPFCTLS